MDTTDSLVDTTTPEHSGCIRHSHTSKNHPSAGRTTDGSTFLRGYPVISAAKKEKAQHIIESLNNYESPMQGRGTAQRMLHPSEDTEDLMPQASSSPRSDSYLTRPDRTVKLATPAMTHRTMSPTPTSTSLSWRKHSMVQPSLSREKRTESDLVQESFRSSNARKYHSNPDSDARTEANYKATDIYQVEDSYWKEVSRMKQSQQRDQAEGMPVQELRQPKSYSMESCLSESGVRIGHALDSPSPQNGRSPVIPRPSSSEDLMLGNTRESQARTYEHPNDISITKSVPGQSFLELRTGCATQGNMTYCVSDQESELSRVDSQATTLQRAISMALQPNEESMQGPRQPPSTKLSTAEVIAARYKQTMAAQSQSVASAQLACKVIQDSSQTGSCEEDEAPAVSGAPRPSHRDRQRQETRSAQPDMAEMLETLQQVREECSRRGHMIETMVDRFDGPGSVDTTVLQVLEDAEKRSKTLEEQLAGYKHQVESMAIDLRALQHGNERVTQDVDVDNKGKGGSTARKVLQHSGNATRNTASCVDALQDVEESYVHKVQRWEHGLSVDQAPDRARATTADPIKRAKRILSREPVGMNGRELPVKDKTSVRGPRRPDSVATWDLSDRVPSSVRGSGIHVQDVSDAAKDETHLLAALKKAEAELQNFRDMQKQRQPLVHEGETGEYPPVRPLTADMMPDASDPYKRTEDKIYQRLELVQIQKLGRVELENLVKNVLVQLDVPYTQVAVRIPELVAQLDTKESGTAALWHETVKLREFAERVHATLYGGDHIEGHITSAVCLSNMNRRVEKLQRALVRHRV